MSTVQHFINEFNHIAPPWMRCSNDPIGLQVGSPQTEVSGVLLALDATEEVLDEAIRLKCNLIITHHPRIFTPLTNLAETSYITKLVTKAIRHQIAIFSAHTNLDIAPDGVNDTLADLIGINSTRKPLTNEQEIPLYKIITFTPASSLEKIQKAAWQSGAGTIGDYKNCAFTSEGQGTFFSTTKCQPTIGNQGEQTVTKECKIEFIVEENLLSSTLQAIKKAHPYEEPACEVYSLKSCQNIGLGRVGLLTLPTTLQELVHKLSQKTQSPMIQFFGNPNKVIKRAGVWSGTGIKIQQIQRHQLEVIVTGEMSYHLLEQLRYFDCAAITLGHAHSEVIILPKLLNKLQNKFPTTTILLSNSPLYALNNYSF